MKIRKNALMMFVIAALLISSFAMTSSLAQGPTKLTVDIIDAPGLGIGNVFTVFVYVWDVEAMYGYNFFLSFDPSVLKVVGHTCIYPFELVFKVIGDPTVPTDPPELNEIAIEKGYIGIGYSMPMGEPNGWYWVGPYPIVSIDFEVVGLGGSMLDLCDSAIGDVYGNYIGHVVEDGWFRNVEGVPIAWFPPMDPLVGEPVTFTSLSIDPDGWIALFDWDWGDGTPHGTLEVETHAWESEGTYPVVLTVTDNDGKTDSQAGKIVVELPPPAGAIPTKGHASQKHLSFTKYGIHKQILMGWARNIDETRPTLVRCELDVWLFDEVHVGAITPDFQWIDPGEQGHFMGEFDMLDGKWLFSGMTYAEYTVYVVVYYADYFIGGDPNNPHWAQVEDAPEVFYTFAVSQSAPVPVLDYTYDSATGTVYLDGTGSYDLDEKWGDEVSGHRWRIYSEDLGLLAQIFSPTLSYTLPQDGNYAFQLRVNDMFVVYEYFMTDYVYFDVP